MAKTTKPVREESYRSPATMLPISQPVFVSLALASCSTASARRDTVAGVVKTEGEVALAFGKHAGDERLQQRVLRGVTHAPQQQAEQGGVESAAIFLPSFLLVLGMCRSGTNCGDTAAFRPCCAA